jgi:retinol dehydrogenase-13
MLPEMPKFPLEDFMNSFYPILLALFLGLILGFRSYMRGAKCPSQSRIDGKIAVVTGADSGIGFETARGLAQRGARVILACREEEKATAAIAAIKKHIGPVCNLSFLKLDLASLQSVREFAAAFSRQEKHLDILVNNAGVMCHPFAKSVDGFELHFQTNYLGHFLLTHLLLGKLKAAPDGGRIINVSANAYKLGEVVLDDLQFERREYNAGNAYSQSKLAVMLFSRRLAQHLDGTQVTVYTVNPGVVRTNIHRHMPFRQNFIVSMTFAPFVWFLMKASVDGAQCSIYCAVASRDEIPSGKYLSECQVTEVDPNAANDEVAEKLWNVSFKLCDLPTSA